MLTGVEAAGLVLAALPIIVQLVEGYESGCKPMRSWLRFRRVYINLLQGIRLQETLFNNNVRILLLPLVDSDDEVRTLLEDAGGKSWQDYELEEALVRRLSTSYKSYLETIERFRATIEAFQKKLGISEDVKQEILQHVKSDPKGLKSSKTINWAYEWARVKTSWADKSLNVLLEEMDRLNKGLRNLLEDGEKLGSLGQGRSSHRPKSKSVQQIRRHASTLYRFLAKQWPCSCKAAHNARVYLRQKPLIDEKVHHGYATRTLYTFEITVAFTTDAPQTDATQTDVTTWRGPVMCSLEPYKENSPSPTPRVEESFSKLKLTTSRFRKTVTIQEPPKAADPTAENPDPMRLRSAIAIQTSICPGLNTCSRNLGPYVEDGYCLLMEVPSMPAHDPSAVPELESLAKLLSRAEQLATSRRIKLAVDLASSFFCIFDTPWFALDWGKEKIKVADGQGAAMLEHQFPDKGKSKTSQNAQEALLRLCICLEELCFGQSLESLATYKSYCDSDGQPNAQTRRNTAYHLLDKIEERLGFSYYDAVQRCLAHSMLADQTQCSNPDFWQKAHDDVVGPLKKVLDVWVS